MIEKHMDATLNLRGHQDATNRLLRHCLSLGTAEGAFPPACGSKQAIGPELDAPARHEPDRPQPRHEPFADAAQSPRVRTNRKIRNALTSETRNDVPLATPTATMPK